MKILKIYNNNIVSCSDKGRECIVTGAGVGFKKSYGEYVEENRIAQRFYLQDDKSKKILQLLERVPTEYYDLSEYILHKAKVKFGKSINLSLFISFTDHLAAAIERFKNNIPLPNIFLMEIKTIWKKEFAFSLWVIDYIEQQIGIRLSIDEAGYFAVYFVSDTIDGKVNVSLELVRMVADIMGIIEHCYNVKLDKSSLSYIRLVTHLRFFIGRIKNVEERNGDVNQEIYELLIKGNQKLVVCKDRIVKFIKNELDYDINQTEIMYLMIHMRQILGN